MIVKLRDNIFLGDKDAYSIEADLKVNGITAVVVVANEMKVVPENVAENIKIFKIGLHGKKYNATHHKDLACHVAKYMVQNGETVMIQSVTGLRRGAYVTCRMICELENKSIYEIFQELKEKVPSFDMGLAYL